jgi:hypothetical protein
MLYNIKQQIKLYYYHIILINCLHNAAGIIISYIQIADTAYDHK